MRKTLLTLPAAAALMGAQGTEPRTPELSELVAVEAILVPIVDGGRVEGTLEVKVVLRTSDANSASAQLPQIRAELRQAAAEYARLHVSPWQAVDSASLAAALDAANRHATPAVLGTLLLEVRARPA